MSIPKLFLKKGKEQSLERFHPWVFSGAIGKTEGNAKDGDLVHVFDCAGNFLAAGHYQTGSITVRILSFESKPIDGSFWEGRLGAALSLRSALGIPSNGNTNMFRLVHGEGDQLPGLIIDVYGSTAVLQAHSVGMHLARHTIAQILTEITGGRIKSVFDKSRTTLLNRTEGATSNCYLLGSRSDETLLENGNRFVVSWEDGQKTGFFLDQRDNRSLLGHYSRGASVLNTFGYTGGFSVYALMGGARRVISVDSSPKAIELTDSNVALNMGNSAPHLSVCADTFEYLKTNREQHDVVVLDPPAFAKHQQALRNALQAYKRLNAEAMARVKPGGLLFTFSCSQVVTRENFRNCVFSAGVIANRQVKILNQLTQPADHPISIYHPEGEYLKGLVLQVE